MKRILFFSIMIITGLTNCTDKDANEDKSIGETEFFVDLPAHGIIIDAKGQMYVAKSGDLNEVYKISPSGECTMYASIDKSISSARIWSLKEGPDGNLYCACRDRIVMISSKGVVNDVYVKDEPVSQAGICDLAFDKKGRLWFTDSGTDSVYMLDENSYPLPMLRKEEFYRFRFLTGILFDDAKDVMYIAACTGNAIYEFPMADDGNPGKPVIHTTPGFIQYLAMGRDKRLFASLIREKSIVTLLDGDVDQIRMTVKDSDTTLDFRMFQTIALGREQYGEEYLYFTSPTGIYKTLISLH